MTREDILRAAEATVLLGEEAGMHRMDRLPKSVSFWHLQDMLTRMQDPAMSMGKLNRWLGWMQACVVAACPAVSLDDMKELNRPKEPPDAR